MTTNGVWEILRWKTEVGGMDKMRPKGRFWFSVVGLSYGASEDTY